jgi:predicted PurR-regulated permease PerM
VQEYWTVALIVCLSAGVGQLNFVLVSVCHKITPAYAFLGRMSRLSLPGKRRILNSMNIQLPRLLAVEMTIIASAIILYFAGHLIGKFAIVAIVLAFSILLTYALLPAVNFLAKFKYIHRGVAILLVYLLLLAVVGGAVALISVPLAKQGEQLARDYPKYTQQVRDGVPKLEKELHKRNINVDLQQQAQEATSNIQHRGSEVAKRSGKIIAEFLGTVSTIILVLFVTVYFLYSGQRFTDAITGLFPRRRQRMVRKLTNDYDRIIGSFVRGNLLIAAIIFVVVTVFCSVVGLPYPTLSGLVAGVTSLVPVIGAFLGVVVPVIVAALVKPVLIPVFLVFFLVLNEVTHKWLYPKIVGDALELHPLVVLIGLLIGAEAAGIAGALLATPLIALLKVTIVALRNTAGYSRL